MPVLAEQLADPRALAKWREFERAFEKFTIHYYAALAGAQNAVAAYATATVHKVAVPWDPTAEQKLKDARAFYIRTTDLIRKVEDHTFGIRLAGGDLDIVQPSESGEQGGWFIPVLVVVGIVALAGAIATAISKTKDVEDCERAFAAVTKYADREFCRDPASPLCRDWIKSKETDQYKSNKGLIDRLAESVEKTGSKLTSGLMIGIMIAVPLIAWSWLGRKSK